MFAYLKAIIKPLYYIMLSRLQGRISSTAFIAPGVHIDLSGGGHLHLKANAELGKGTMLWTQGGDIIIGEGSRVGPACILYGHGGLEIGADVIIGAQTIFIPANHIFSNINRPIKTQGHTSRGIKIEDDVWIGAGVKILDGVKIGTGSVIAAGSVVNRDVPSYSVVAGIPSRVIKKRS